MRGPSRRHLALGSLLVALCMAPTPGDVGGCGAPAIELGARGFFKAKREVDCRRCEECDVFTRLCAAACDPTVPTATRFEPGCLPVEHDGRVCLRALEAASCEDYAAFMDDGAPSVPTECNFCPAGGP